MIHLANKVKDKKESQISHILAGKEFVVTIDHDQFFHDNKYPTLSRYGISAENKRILNDLLRDIYNAHYNKHKSTTLQFNYKNNVKQTLIMVPTATNSYHLCCNKRAYLWIDNILEAMKGNLPNKSKEENCHQLLTYIGTKSKY